MNRWGLILLGRRSYPRWGGDLFSRSVRLNTTVKPKGSEQYDVDLLCYLPNASVASGWAEVLEAVRARLASHGTYSEMLTPLPRGHRIMYAGEYHLDITPELTSVITLQSTAILS